MSIKITSNNQSGGVTGQNINIGGSFQSESSAMPTSTQAMSRRKIMAWIIGSIGFLASIFGILDYLGIKLWG